MLFVVVEHAKKCSFTPDMRCVGCGAAHVLRIVNVGLVNCGMLGNTEAYTAACFGENDATCRTASGVNEP